MGKMIQIAETLQVRCPHCGKSVVVENPKADVPFMMGNGENTCFCEYCKMEFTATFKVCVQIATA